MEAWRIYTLATVKQIYGGGGGGLVAKLCPTLVNPWTVACQAPLLSGSPIPGILQARTLEWVAISFSNA